MTDRMTPARLLSPREMADALGVSESSLKRWVDAGKIRAMRTEGGHRRIALAEAVRFVRESGAPLARPELLGIPEIAFANQSALTGGSTLVDHLRRGDIVGTRGWLLGRYLEGATLTSLFDGAIRDAMHQLGELWEHDQGGIFIEHRATDVCLQAIAHLRAALEPPATALLAVGCTPEDDPYLLPSFMAATVIASAGMRAMNLGPDTPLSALQHVVDLHQPKLVWVSASAQMPAAQAKAFARYLSGLPRTITAVCGGRAAKPLAEGGVRYLESMSELHDIASTLAQR